MRESEHRSATVSRRASFREPASSRAAAQLEAADANHDEADPGKPFWIGALAEQQDAHHHGSGSTDPGPDRIGRPDWQDQQAAAEQEYQRRQQGEGNKDP